MQSLFVSLVVQSLVVSNEGRQVVLRNVQLRSSYGHLENDPHDRDEETEMLPVHGREDAFEETRYCSKRGKKNVSSARANELFLRLEHSQLTENEKVI